jgi:predicted transcriptional regulator
MDNEQNNKVHLTTSAPKRFVPTCTICGNQHWPRDPSCLGKKGAKAKAKAKGAAKAKARAKRLGNAGPATAQPAESPVQVRHVMGEPKTTYPAMPSATPGSHQTPYTSAPAYPAAQNVSAAPIQPSIAPVFPPRQNTDIQPQRPQPPQQPQQHHGGETVFKINAKSHEEITSFNDEITRIKRQADEVVLRISEDAAHRVDAERNARRNADEKALNEAAARLKAEQKLQQEIDKLKTLQQEARLAVQANQMQMQEIQAQFTDVSNNADGPAALKPFESRANSVSVPIDPGHNGCNTATLLAIHARQIMETNVIQVSADDTVSRVLDQMLSVDSYYAVVTGDDRTEGIVSRADLTGPVSEYLRPLIAKWQRSGSDATYNLAVKWIMSRQVNTIDAGASCTAIMKKMRDLNMCPLLVIEDGQPIGLVTPFNVFKIRALLKLESDTSSTTNRQLIEALPARISSYLNDLNAAKNPQQQLVK